MKNAMWLSLYFLFYSAFYSNYTAYSTSPQHIIILSYDVDKMPEQQIHS